MFGKVVSPRVMHHLLSIQNDLKKLYAPVITGSKIRANRSVVMPQDSGSMENDQKLLESTGELVEASQAEASVAESILEVVPQDPSIGTKEDSVVACQSEAQLHLESSNLAL